MIYIVTPIPTEPPIEQGIVAHAIDPQTDRCEVCGTRFEDESIVHDCPTRLGPWAHICTGCFATYGLAGGTVWRVVSGFWEKQR